jgi:hypothetical protein
VNLAGVAAIGECPVVVNGIVVTDARGGAAGTDGPAKGPTGLADKAVAAGMARAVERVAVVSSSRRTNASIVHSAVVDAGPPETPSAEKGFRTSFTTVDAMLWTTVAGVIDGAEVTLASEAVLTAGLVVSAVSRSRPDGGEAVFAAAGSTASTAASRDREGSEPRPVSVTFTVDEADLPRCPGADRSVFDLEAADPVRAVADVALWPEDDLDPVAPEGGDAESDDAESDDEVVLSADAVPQVTVATARPTPRSTANAPTRPTYVTAIMG